MFDPQHIYPRGQEKYFKGHIMMHLKNKNLLPWVKKKPCWGKNLKKKTTMSREKQWKQSYVKGNIVIHLKGMILICVKESHENWNNDILGQKKSDILNDILAQ